MKLPTNWDAKDNTVIVTQTGDGDLLLEDGVSMLLQEDGTGLILLEDLFLTPKEATNWISL
jgi:hypothetical protein